MLSPEVMAPGKPLPRGSVLPLLGMTPQGRLRSCVSLSPRLGSSGAALLLREVSSEWASASSLAGARREERDGGFLQVKQPISAVTSCLRPQSPCLSPEWVGLEDP